MCTLPQTKALHLKILILPSAVEVSSGTWNQVYELDEMASSIPRHQKPYSWRALCWAVPIWEEIAKPGVTKLKEANIISLPRA